MSANNGISAHDNVDCPGIYSMTPKPPFAYRRERVPYRGGQVEADRHARHDFVRVRFDVPTWYLHPATQHAWE
eukprot:5159471-Pyramimonas_sp.AAC.1